MPEAAGALLALWNDVDASLEDDYEAWHAREHVPERLTVPGMRWGLRYRAAPGTPGPRYLTLYGLADAGVLDGDPYRRLLREPTPTSARLRPALRHVSRWVCDVRELARVGRGDSLALWTLNGADAAPARGRLQRFADDPGITGWLLAERRHDAAPLPWLGGDQGGGVDGDWLLCAFGDALDRSASALATARLYRQLPVD